jgi:phage terminase large subunit-like protein
MTKSQHPHVEKALAYAEAVVAGKIPASKITQQACKRQLDDIKRKYHATKWPYVFSLAKAERICNFLELLSHIKGDKAGTRIVLEAWQCFYLTTLFGWLNKSTGFRRFRTSYLEVPRKNGKSVISSGVMLYMATADDEAGAECYSAATTKKQARIVFDVALKMARKSPAFLQKYGVTLRAHDILVRGTDSVCEPVSAEADNLDGLNPHFASVDELHAHKTRAVYDVMETGCGARTQSLLSIITTAGSDITGICYELRDYSIKVLKRVFPDESFFAMIYTIDPEDDWTTDLAFRKANPNYGISVRPEYLENLCRKAKRSSASQGNFKTKHLNVWAQSDTAWMNMDKYNRCASVATSIDDFRGMKCWIGLDLASKLDITALVMLFHLDGLWYVFCKFYLPEEVVEEKEHTTLSHYAGWSTDGYLTLTPGNVIDYDIIEEDIKEICDTFDVQSVGFDPWQATQLANNLTAAGVPMVEVRATVQNFSEPMKEVESLVYSNKLRPGHNPVLSWMVSNVVCHRDKKENIYPNKERPDNKIDGVIGLIIALSRAILPEESTESIYETRGILGT